MIDRFKGSVQGAGTREAHVLGKEKVTAKVETWCGGVEVVGAVQGDGTNEFVIHTTPGTRVAAGGGRVLATVSEHGRVSIHDQAIKTAIVREYLEAVDYCRRACPAVRFGLGAFKTQHANDCKAAAYGID